MPEETKVSPAEVPVYVEVTNDETSKTLKFALSTVKKGKSRGNKAIALHPSESMDSVVEFYGLKKFYGDWLLPKLNSFFYMLTKESTTEAGEEDQDSFKSMVIKLSPRGETYAALMQRLADLVDELIDPALTSEERDAVIRRFANVKAALDEKKIKKEEDSNDANVKVA